jgi:serine/threonine protein phosphatase PrpC
MLVDLTVYGQTDVGLVRRSNEDAFVVADLTGGSVLQERRIARFEVEKHGVLLAVSDGLGGHKAGEVASALVVESLRRSLTRGSAGSVEDDDALMEEATRRANREVWEAARFPGRERMGATLTAVFVHGGTAHIAEVGDSRAYLLRGGAIEQITHDQSYVQLLMDQGAITKEQAEHGGFQNVILQAMGLEPDVSVALGRLELRQYDCFVLCSDGLSNKVTAEELRSIVLTSRRLDAACIRMIELAKQRGGEDNITVIVAGASGDLPALVPGEPIAETLEVLQEFDPPHSSSGSSVATGLPETGQEKRP